MSPFPPLVFLVHGKNKEEKILCVKRVVVVGLEKLFSPLCSIGRKRRKGPAQTVT